MGKVEIEVRRKRLPREEREKLIVEEAIRFFAEVGFEGQTRALAERLGVTQPLLYRYFPDKDALIVRVFDEVYLKRWRPEWATLLRDRPRPLVDRVIEFYKQFCTIMFNADRVRIFMFAGLKDESINALYLENLRVNVLEPMVDEMRHAHGLPSVAELPLDELEVNLAWALHGSIFHIALRKWIYRLPLPDDLDLLVECTIRAFMEGSGEALRCLHASRKAA